MAKILLIDDDDDLLTFLRDALERRGDQVRCLTRAEGGVDVLETGEFDLVLVDEKMPGMLGTDFLKVLRRHGLGIPAILMTGYAKGAIVQDAKKLDAFVVSKPSGGNEEIWKELAPLLADALKGDAEMIASLRRAIDAALKAGKTNLAPRLRKMLDQELLARALTEADGDQDEAARILGVSLAELVSADSKGSKAKARIGFHAEALILIMNHPEWTVDELAQKLGCSRAKLYRNATIKRALMSKKGGSFRGPSGFKDTDGDVDAYD
jgi:DNA-binding NtrC family response regulator